MNAFLDALLLGIVQGFTEFLPVSSTGHLIIMERYLDFHVASPLFFDVILHAGTACAVLWYFRTFWFSLIREHSFRIYNAQTLAIVIATIPAVIAGLLFQDMIESQTRTIEAVIIGLVIGSVLIMIAEYVSAKRTLSQSIERAAPPTPVQSFIIGIFQALALYPGISRSGATISAGLLMGKDRMDATRFSFILSTPIILGITVKESFAVWKTIELSALPLYAIGFLSSFIAGLCAVFLLERMMKTTTLKPFVYYRILLAGLLLLVLFF